MTWITTQPACARAGGLVGSIHRQGHRPSPESRAAGTRPDLSYADLTDTILRGTRLPVEEH